MGVFISKVSTITTEMKDGMLWTQDTITPYWYAAALWNPRDRKIIKTGLKGLAMEKKLKRKLKQVRAHEGEGKAIILLHWELNDKNMSHRWFFAHEKRQAEPSSTAPKGSDGSQMMKCLLVTDFRKMHRAQKIACTTSDRSSPAEKRRWIQ